MASSRYQTLQNEGSNVSMGYGSIGFSETTPNVAYVRSQSTEFFQYCDKITTNLFTINKAATTLERCRKQIGTPADNQVLRDRITQVNSDAGGNIQDTTSFLRSIHSLTKGDKQRKIRAQKLQNEFQATATRFSEIQMKILNVVRSARLPSDMIATELDEEPSVADQMQKEGEQLHIKKQELKSLEFEFAMQQEREHRIHELESDIVNINDIMRELSSIIASQGEVVTSIEGNVETSHAQVEEGREQLVKAAIYQNKSRKRLCFLLLIVIVLVCIVSIILAIHFTNNK